jgi:hypothetical protein
VTTGRPIHLVYPQAIKNSPNTNGLIMIQKFILLTFFILVHVISFGQTANPSSDTIRWNSAGFTDQNTNVLVQKTCQFITYGSSKIDWIQKGGKLTYTFNITGINGTWTDANTDGTITYNVSFEDFSGSLVINRSGTLSISLNIISPDDKIINLYSISNFDIL